MRPIEHKYTQRWKFETYILSPKSYYAQFKRSKRSYIFRLWENTEQIFTGERVAYTN